MISRSQSRFDGPNEGTPISHDAGFCLQQDNMPVAVKCQATGLYFAGHHATGVKANYSSHFTQLPPIMLTPLNSHSSPALKRY